MTTAASFFKVTLYWPFWGDWVTLFGLSDLELMVEKTTLKNQVVYILHMYYKYYN